MKSKFQLVGGMIGERVKLVVWAALLVVGVVLSFGRGLVPVRAAAVERTAMEIKVEVSADDGTPPDLALYSDVIAEVRAGRGYYEVAREKIPQYGFPIASPLNWRLPTYAWLLSRLPNKIWVQAVLLVLAIGGMWMTFVASREREEQSDRFNGAKAMAGTARPIIMAGLTTFLMFGVARWTFDGQAYLAQEPWAAVLIVISLAAGAMVANRRGRQGEVDTRRCAWSAVSIWAGTLALLFRELALPYCLVAGAMAAWKRRWSEAAGWAVGIGMFFALLAWHVGQVKAQLAGTDVAAGGGIAQWLRFGGLDFVLLTTRMNSVLFAAPGWVLWLYVLVALLGLGRGRDETSQVACGAALLYLLAFAIVGRPENFYWGLLPAPLLVWGVGHGLMEIRALLGQPAVAPETAVVRCTATNAGASVPGHPS